MRGICFQIKDILVETTLQKCLEEMGEVPYAIVLSPSTWMKYRDSFDMGFDMDPNPENIYNSKAEVNYDSITGTFSIPNREDIGGEDAVFSFALDEKGVVFIDRSGMAENLIKATELHRKITFLQEGVGGLIDLAIITREDGFQWLNRKSWYEPSKGGRYGKFGI